MQPGRRFLAAVLLGGLQAGALNFPSDWGWAAALLQALSLSGLVAVLNQAAAQRSPELGPSPWLGQGLALGWAFATTWLAGTFWWLFISMHRYGGLSAPLAALAVLALAAALSFYYGLSAAFYVRWRTLGPSPMGWAAGVFAAAWTLAELARGSWFTGFPWGAGGYAQVAGLAPALAPWVGVYGVGAVVALGAAVLASAGRAVKQVGVALCCLAGAGVYWGTAGGLTAPLEARASSSLSRPLSVALLQGNIPQDQKFEAGSGVAQALAWYREQIETIPPGTAGTPELVITPETAIPWLPQDLPSGYWARLTTLRPDQAVLLGLPFGDAQNGYRNSVLGLRGGPTAEAPLYRYDKHHLVPFGEFIPTGFRWFTDLLHIPMGDFQRGGLAQPSFAWQGQRLAPMICYEDLFGEEMGARFRDPRQAPTVLVNMSNLAWFGDSTAAAQHLQISRLRALEFARPVVRATNTGATAVIDAQGRVTHALPPFSRGVLRAEVQGGEGQTPYAWWVSRWGLQPLAALAVLIALAAHWRQRRHLHRTRA